MSPFIGSVAASCTDAPSGIATTDAAGTTRSAAWAPPSGRRGLTAAITASPAASRSTPDPTDSTVPAASIPGVHGGSSPWAPVARRPMSVGLTAAAATAIRTSPSAGSRTGRSMTSRTSGPPGSRMPTARAMDRDS